MASSYTVFWPSDRCRQAQRSGHEGAPLTVLFGGPHQSQPNFRRAGVRDGDAVYPISVHKGTMYVLGWMRVQEIRSVPEDEGDVHAVAYGYAAWRYLAPTCTDEVVVGEKGTPLRFDVAVPAGVLASLVFCSQRGERRIRQIRDGRLTSSIGVQGIYRLNERSATDLAALLSE